MSRRARTRMRVLRGVVMGCPLRPTILIIAAASRRRTWPRGRSVLTHMSSPEMSQPVPLLLFIPGLDHDLAGDLAVLELEHRLAEHLGAVGIDTGLCEREPIALCDGCLHPVCDRAA